ncbi:hypothetical protein GQ53DRAFT_844565 [Thozetella sp. PMI_491]|nr:hypothetical protein GQ53DRAFT_844565 [Thozetella sp. PMI_491]
MLRRTRLPCGLAAALLALPCVQVFAAPTVDIAMKAAFPSPPYLVELLETAAPENTTTYFALLDSIAEGRFTTAKTDKELYEKFLEILQQDGHATAETLSTFKLALSMRSSAPRVEAHYQHYETAITPNLAADSQDACENWWLYNGKQHCSVDLQSATGDLRNSSQDRILPFDRLFGNGAGDFVLYADITSPAFGEFHKKGREMAKKSLGSYRLRYKRSKVHPSEPLPVNGYGVELALKRTDYIVIDDRGSEGAKAETDAEQKVVASEVVLDEVEEMIDIKPLEKSELASLGMKAAAFIMQSESPFDSLIRLTQDFPRYSTSLGAYNVSAEFEAEQQGNLANLLSPGLNVLFMNGLQLIDRQIQPFGLVDLLQKERKLIQGVLDLGLTGAEATALLGHNEVAQAKTAGSKARRFDWRDEIEDGKVIIWLNNIEKDKRYEAFAPTLMGLLQPAMPGSLPQVRRDIFNLVVPVDFSKAADVNLIVDQLLTFMKRLVPIRFGLVPLTPTEEAAKQAKISYYLLETYGLSAMAAYWQASLDGKKTAIPDETLFAKAIKDRDTRPESTILSFDEILTNEHYQSQVEHAKHWTGRLQANGAVPPVFFDGASFPRDENWLNAMNQVLRQDLRAVQENIWYGMIDEEMWLPAFFLDGAITRRNTYIYPEDAQDLTLLDVNKVSTEHHDLLTKIPVIEADERAPKEDWAALTLITDLDDAEGQKLLLNALIFRQEHPGVRLDIVHNPADTSKAPSTTNGRVKTREDSLVTIARLEDLKAVVEGGRVDADPAYDAALTTFLAALNGKPGDSLLMLNGRLIGPIASANDFQKDDFDQFLSVEQEIRILPVYKALEELGLADKVTGPLAAAKISSVTAASSSSELPQGIFQDAPSTRMSVFKDWSMKHTGFEVGNKDTATIFLTAVLNPATELGQKWAPILKVLSELEGVHLQVFLNPKDGLDELPVKRFYRYVLKSAPTFDENGKVAALSGKFTGVPSETLLIAGMDVPPAWLVSSKVSVDDLDNLKIKDIKARRNTENIEAIYELEHILIEGHSRELPDGQPPRGVQLVLGTDKDAHFADTIIMSNLGFFQFKANPGVYNIKLKEGRSSEIFTLQSVGAHGWAATVGDEGNEIALMDFQGTTLYPRLVRKEGMEEEDVLAEPKSGGTMDFVSKGLKFAEGILGTKGKKADKSVSDVEHAEINIFSVASGHLYERMLNIMMVSVMRHTKHTVKFWFIEQFLSPSFKDFIPTMAEEYGFKYEMVTYKWPHWLRGQREKQREIWGYKILFLDVLFPLSLDKVIFVDADQVVRTDMYDLVQHDLQGAPYGFTPMCDSRTEMEGFRFWKTGYWANYLKGLPYHISALYVVDLRRFRELAAGDRLRQQYHTLSADPNSLSNLDQDLPNHMQTVIPIHSLPQEWLWCETWCSDEAFKEARTVDLCNNPLTHEPKLSRARRQLPEWTVYDDEIAALAKRRAVLKPETEGQKVLSDEDGAEVEKNTKSRKLEAEPTKKEHKKDEL